MRKDCLIVIGTIVLLIIQGGCMGGRSDTVIITDRDSDTVWVRVLLEAGSAYDPPGKEGLALATAAAVQRGYGSSIPEELTDRLAELSARVDVWVDRCVTGFDGACPRANWAEFSELFASLFAEPRVGNEAIAYLVADQLASLDALRQDDARLARAILQQRLYGDHPWAHPPEGTDHSVIDLIPTDIRDFWSTRYAAGGLLLGVAGNISESEAGRLRASLTAVLPPGDALRSEPPAGTVDGLQLAAIEMPIQDPTALLIGCRADITRGDPDFPAFQLANTWLGRHGGRLSDLLDTRRNISFVSWSYVEHTEPYIETDVLNSGRPRPEQYFFVETQPTPANAAFIVNLVLVELEQLVTQGIPGIELESARTDLLNEMRTAMSHPAYRMGMALDARWLDIPDMMDGIVETLERVTLEDTRRALARTIKPDSMIVVAVVPSGQGLVTQLLRRQISYAYPEGINRMDMRSEDLPYLSCTPPWHVQRMRIFNAEEMYR